MQASLDDDYYVYDNDNDNDIENSATDENIKGKRDISLAGKSTELESLKLFPRVLNVFLK